LSTFYREGIIDPAAIFAMLFGSERFEDYIGELAMASMASLDNFGDDENIDTKKLAEKMQVCSFSMFCIDNFHDHSLCTDSMTTSSVLATFPSIFIAFHTLFYFYPYSAEW
jgi:hypothetical protein